MKRIARVTFLMLLALLFLLPVSGRMARAEEEGNWSYSVKKDGTAKITAYKGSEKKVELPGALGGYVVTEIGEKVFTNNITVEEVVFADTYQTIGNSAFAGCSSLTAVTFNEGLQYIGNNAFEATKIKTLTIPDSVYHMGRYAFQNCTGLRSLTLGNGITEWEYYYGTNAAFAGCTLLMDLELKDGLKSIGSYAFEGCTLLMEVTMPESIETVEDAAFRSCELLDTATVYGSIGFMAFQNCTSLADLTLHNTLSIGNNAFEGDTALASVELPEVLTSIGENAFNGCTKLKSITIPDSVTYVGEYSFQNNTQLETVVLGSGIKEWGTYYSDNSAFRGCTKLKNLTIKEGVAYLPAGIFRDCTVLAEVEIPGSCDRIDDNAFQNCPSLTTVTMNDGLHTIGAYAFRECPALAKADLPASLLSIGNEAFRGSQLRSVVIPDKVMSIGYYAFRECPALTDVTIGESVEKWETYYGENGAFQNCPRIENVTIKDGVLSVGTYAFQNCVSLKEVEIPITATAVGAYAFDGCSRLSKLTMLRGEIQEGAFRNCTSLYDLTLKRITTIGRSAFQNAKVLYELNLPGTVTMIGRSAFDGCASLSSVEIPDSVTEIGAYAFANCTGLLTAKIGNNITTWGTDYGTGGLFMNDTALQYAVLEDGANSLGEGVFRGCTALVGVSLPETVVSYGKNLFNKASETVVIHVSGSKMADLATAESRTSTKDPLVIPDYETCTVSITAGEGGQASPAGDIVKPIGSAQFVYSIADAGYMLESCKMDGSFEYVTKTGMKEVMADQMIGLSGNRSLEVRFTADPDYVDPYPPLDKEEETPAQEGETPAAEGEPAQEGETPAAEGEPAQEAETPGAQGSEEAENTGLVRFTEEHPSYKMVNIYLQGLLSGASDSFLSEASPVSEAAFLSFLYRIDGAPQVEWKDYGPNVPAGSWYGNAVVYAVSKNVLTEAEASAITPAAPLTGSRLAELARRFAESRGLKVVPEDAAPGDVFSWAAENGLCYQSKVSPDAPVTCGQCTRLLTSFLADLFG